MSSRMVVAVVHTLAVAEMSVKVGEGAAEDTSWLGIRVAADDMSQPGLPGSWERADG